MQQQKVQIIDLPNNNLTLQHQIIYPTKTITKGYPKLRKLPSTSFSNLNSNHKSPPANNPAPKTATCHPTPDHPTGTSYAGIAAPVN